MGGLAHGALDAGAGGVEGFPLRGGLLGAGDGERLVQVAGADVRRPVTCCGDVGENDPFHPIRTMQVCAR